MSDRKGNVVDFRCSIQVLPLRDATVLNFTSPVFTIVLATVFLKESWSGVEAAGRHAGDKSISDLYVGVAAALAAAALGALSLIVLRIIGQHGEPPLVPVFAFAAFSTPMAALGTLVQGFKLLGVTELTFMFIVGSTAYVAQVFLTRSLQLDKATSVAPIQYLKVLFTFILGVMFLQEIPTLWDVLGAILIIGSAATISNKNSHE